MNKIYLTIVSFNSLLVICCISMTKPTIKMQQNNSEINHEALSFVKEKKIFNEKYGEHYISCPWSNPEATCGPDTCKCMLEELTKTLENDYGSDCSSTISESYNGFSCNFRLINSIVCCILKFINLIWSCIRIVKQ
jgi:hypothetical protein